MTVIPPTDPLAYQGKDPVKKDYIFRRAPTPADFSAYEIGDSWIDILTGSFYVLTSKTGGIAGWAIGGMTGATGVLTINGLLPDGVGEFGITAGLNITVTPGVNAIAIATDVAVPSSFTSDAGVAVPVANNLDILGAAGITTAGAGDTITISGGGFSSSFPTDAGTATPAAGIVNVLGGTGIGTVGAGNTITVNVDGTVATNYEGDFGGPAVPSGNSLFLVGQSTSDFTPSGICTSIGATTEEMYFENRRFPSAFIVDANTTTGNRGEYSTLTTAAAAMSAGDTMYVRPGSYSENWTPAINTTVVGLTSIGQNQRVTFAGTTNAPVGAGVTCLQNINLSTGGGVACEAQGGAGSTLIFIDCNFSHTNHCIRFVSGNIVCNRCDFASSAAETIVSESTGGGEGTFEDCNINGAGGFATVQQSIASTLTFTNSVISGGDESFQATAAATANFIDCRLSPGMNLELVTVNMDHCKIDALGATTGMGMEAGTTFNGSFTEITAPGEQAFEINGASTVTLYNMMIDSGSGGNWIDIAAGSSLEYGNITLLDDTTIGTGGTITPVDVQPYATTTTVGTASFDTADFTVSTAGAVSLNSSPVVWREETGTSATFVANEGIIANNAALVTLTLPATCAVGEVLEVCGKGAGGWRIAQVAGQTIHFNSSDTTTGAGGSLDSTIQYNAVKLLCTIANTDYTVLTSLGVITVV